MAGSQTHRDFCQLVGGHEVGDAVAIEVSDGDTIAEPGQVFIYDRGMEGTVSIA